MAIPALAVAAAAGCFDGMFLAMQAWLPLPIHPAWLLFAIGALWGVYHGAQPRCLAYSKGWPRKPAAAGNAARPCGTMIEALRESEARFRDFASASSDWFWETGPDFRFSWLSESLITPWIGARADEIIGKTHWQLAGASIEDPC
jgi:hypothetical protein